MIPLKNFTENTTKGLIKIEKVNDAFAITKKHFDPDTGEALPDEVVSIDPQELEKEKINLTTAVAEIDAVLTHLKTVV